MVERTAKGGGELVNLMGTSAWYAPGAAAAQMVDSIMLDEKRVLPCTAYLEGEYGIDGLYMGVPCKLGPGGIEQIIELDLSDDEQQALQASVGGRPRGRRRAHDLAMRNALVTGVSRRAGIGFAIARRLRKPARSVFTQGWTPHDAARRGAPTGRSSSHRSRRTSPIPTAPARVVAAAREALGRSTCSSSTTRAAGSGGSTS